MSEPTRTLLPVTQADREASAAMWRELQGVAPPEDWQADWMQNGAADGGPVVQAFAMHRLAHQPQPVNVERLKTLIAKRRAFVAAREAMNAARPTDTLTATRAQYVLYDERYQADNEACRELHREAARFAEWAAGNEEAAISAMQAGLL